MREIVLFLVDGDGSIDILGLVHTDTHLPNMLQHILHRHPHHTIVSLLIVKLLPQVLTPSIRVFRPSTYFNKYLPFHSNLPHPFHNFTTHSNFFSLFAAVLWIYSASTIGYDGSDCCPVHSTICPCIILSLTTSHVPSLLLW